MKLSYKATLAEAESCMKRALKKLIKIRFHHNLFKSIKNNDLTSLSMSLRLNSSKDSVIDKAVYLSFFNEGNLPYCQQNFEAFYNRDLESFVASKTKVELLFTEINKAKEQLNKEA